MDEDELNRQLEQRTERRRQIQARSIESALRGLQFEIREIRATYDRVSNRYMAHLEKLNAAMADKLEQMKALHERATKLANQKEGEDDADGV